MDPVDARGAAAGRGQGPPRHDPPQQDAADAEPGGSPARRLARGRLPPASLWALTSRRRRSELACAGGGHPHRREMATAVSAVCACGGAGASPPTSPRHCLAIEPARGPRVLCRPPKTSNEKLTGLAQILGQVQSSARDFQSKYWANVSQTPGQPAGVLTSTAGAAEHRARRGRARQARDDEPAAEGRGPRPDVRPPFRAHYACIYAPTILCAPRMYLCARPCARPGVAPPTGSGALLRGKRHVDRRPAFGCTEIYTKTGIDCCGI